MRLNGWRRLGVLLTTVWVVGVLTVAAVEIARFQRGVFVYQGIPKGTVVRGDKATLPDGMVVQLDARDPATGRVLNPWEIDWANEPAIAKQTSVRWLKLSVLAVVVPIAVWLLIELLAVAGTWVLRGFKSRR
jgi:hypothetical protein